MNRKHYAAVVGAAAVLVAATAGAGLAYASRQAAPHAPASVTADGSSYAYYQSMMARFGANSMMGGSQGSMMGETGYGQMMGGTNAPGWMRGNALPGYMMGTSTDPGKIMGALLANAPGPRITPIQATGLGNQTPSGASIDITHRVITLAGSTVSLIALASPAGGPDETFRIAGLVNPTLVVKTGARVTIEVVNADPNTAHGLVVTTTGATSSYMPMMTTSPAFNGAAVWFLGDPTTAGMHQATLTFTATTPGTYRYICAVPGHAQKGMVGTFIVTT